MSDIVEPKTRIERAWSFVKGVRGYLDGSRIGFAREELAEAQRVAELENIPMGDAQTAYSDQLIVPLYEASAQALERIEAAEDRIAQIRTYDGTALASADVPLTDDEPTLVLTLGALSHAEIVVETGERTVPLRISTAALDALKFESLMYSYTLSHCLDSLDGLPTENSRRKASEEAPGWRLQEWYGAAAQLPQIHQTPIQDGGIFVACGEKGVSVFAWASRAATARVSLFRAVGSVSLPEGEPLTWSKWNESREPYTTFLFAVKRRGIRSAV